jgi:hypothetical protein
MDAIRKYEIKYHVSGPKRPDENPAKALVLHHAQVEGASKAVRLWFL